MSFDRGMGTCLVPVNGIPCGGQIEDGESIRNLTLPFGGSIVGHKRCVDAYETAKNTTPPTEENTDMVKIAHQQGPGGPVDLTTAQDATAGSIPLEKSPHAPDLSTPDPNAPVTSADGLPLRVRPVSELPFTAPTAPTLDELVAQQGSPIWANSIEDQLMRLSLRVNALEEILATLGGLSRSLGPR